MGWELERAGGESIEYKKVKEEEKRTENSVVISQKFTQSSSRWMFEREKREGSQIRYIEPRVVKEVAERGAQATPMLDSALLDNY